MDSIMTFVNENWQMIVFTYSAIVTITSWIVRLTPGLADDNIVLPIIKFLGKYIAVNTNAPIVRPK